MSKATKTPQPQRTARSLWQSYRDDTCISRCEQYAKWTLPYLMADLDSIGVNGRVMVERDFQEIGAMLVNNLASKLTRILFPTQYPFFRASASETFKQYARKLGYDDEALRSAFSKMEMQANERLFINAGYANLIMAMKFLIVTGNVLLYRDSAAGRILAYGLQSFTCRRDGTGEVLACILKEHSTVQALPEEIRQELQQKAPGAYTQPEKKVEKYTRIEREDRNGRVGYSVQQEIDTTPVGKPSWYPKHLCPWMLPTWNLIPGEHYGRGIVEDYAGGFAKLSALSEAATLYAVEALRVVHLVGPGAGNDVDSLAASESGEWVRADPGAVQVHEAGDSQKLAIVEQQIDRIVTRLARAFMYQGGTRDAERVTAYELQLDAQEAEYALGGVYSSLSGSIQIPLAHILLTEVSDMALAGLISGEIMPDVTAGIPALGRSSDVQNLLMAAQELVSIAPVVQLDERLNPQKIVDLVLAGRSIDPDTLFYTPEQLQQIREAKQAQQMAQQNLLQANTLAQQGEQIQNVLGG